jgi:hypothetical protein
LILVPAKPEPEIDFCRNSGQKMPEFNRVFCDKSKDNLKSAYLGLIWILNMKVKVEQMFSRFRLNPINIPV